MPNCNDTKTFLAEWKRICNTYHCNEKCPFAFTLTSCFKLAHKDPDLAVEVIQRWSDKHPATDEQQVTA